MSFAATPGEEEGSLEDAILSSIHGSGGLCGEGGGLLLLPG